jgi:hypothetical protein
MRDLPDSGPQGHPEPDPAERRFATGPMGEWVLLTAFVVVVAVNYVAQVPYYVILYSPRPPSPVGTTLLVATLVWFLVGFIRYRRRRAFGTALFLGFVAAEVLFYGGLILLALVTGGRAGAGAQLSEPDPRLWAIFAVGYANFAIAVPTMIVVARNAVSRGRLSRI